MERGGNEAAACGMHASDASSPESAEQAARKQSAARMHLSQSLELPVSVVTSGAISRRKDQALFKNLFGVRGVTVSDRKLNDKVLVACCVGNEVVDWLVREQKISRREAVAVGQSFVEKGLLVPADDSAPVAFEDKFTFFRRTLRGDAIASHAGSSRGERVGGARKSRDIAEARSPLSLSPRMGRGAPSDEDATALTDLVSALSKTKSPAPVAIRKSPAQKARGGAAVQTPNMPTASSRHASVNLTARTAAGLAAERMSMDLGGNNIDMSGLVNGGVRRSGTAAVRAASEWRKSSMQAGPSSQSASNGLLLMTAKEEVMEGWLHKQSSRDPTVWKRRHLVLKGGKTVYSRLERGADAEIPMDVVGSVRMAPEAHPLAFCIDAVTRTFVLRAETRDELNAWVFAYHKAALLVLDLLTAPGHVPRESRLRLQKWWKQRNADPASAASPEAGPAVESTAESGENGVDVGAAWSMGRRPTMEDSHLLLPDLREELAEEEGCVALFGVFDGHGGQLAANMARDQLLAVLSAQSSWGTDDEAVLAAGVVELDRRICAHLMSRGDRSGTCAVVALLREDDFLVAHCGDCRAVIAFEDDSGALESVLQLTRDHKPEQPEEKARVEAAGGFVTLQTEPDLSALHRKTPAQLAEMQRVVATTGKSLATLCGSVQIARVMGSLSVSRSLGDVGFKDMKHSLFPGRKFSADLVIATPEVARVSLRGRRAVAILACDGLWDVLTADKAAAIAHSVLRSGKTVREAAITLVDRAMKRGTLDNVSAIVVVLPSQHK